MSKMFNGNSDRPLMSGVGRGVGRGSGTPLREIGVFFKAGAFAFAWGFAAAMARFAGRFALDFDRALVWAAGLRADAIFRFGAAFFFAFATTLFFFARATVNLRP
jgi:hypothetical protein